MVSERQKMLAGELYDPFDPGLRATREIGLDVCEVRIGSYMLFGPGAQILTPMHPFNAAMRKERGTTE